MKKYCLFFMAVMLFTLAFANRVEVIAYEEDFESGADGWIHYDGAESPNMWHVYDFGGVQGDVWWMGDPSLAQGNNIGGYYSHQYLVLDTPARTITADNATLTFKMRIGLEDPAVHESWDGWDSCNVRLSTNGGQTWQVIHGTPAYHFNNSYAFGHEHGEGPGIPGWGGIWTEWIDASFNLSAYVGQSVMIRFAFASDPAYDTGDQRNMFGFMVDDISFGGYTNNGVDDGQMTSSSLVPLGGDIWHLAVVADAPSPVHAMRNQNDQGTYNPNMLNYLVSPTITLPASGEIRADFMIKGDFSDTGTFPNVDYWGWQISIDGGDSWRYMSNPYADPSGNNYVYSDAPDIWASMVESYSLNGYISEFAGMDVKFRWYFQSNDTVNGSGIMIDDFRIYNEVFITPPENLSLTVEGNTVNLQWDSPGMGGGGGGEEGWLHYDNGDNLDAIGTGNAADFDVAIKWDAQGAENSIYPYVGMNITKIKFWPHEPNCQYSVRLWTGSGMNLVYDQLLTTVNTNSWNEIVLDTPFTIPSGTAVGAGYRCNTQTGHPAGIDGSAAVQGYGNLIKLGGWTTLAQYDIDGNWNIQVYVQDANGREYVIGEPLPENPTYAFGSLESVPSSPRGRAAADLIRIYRNDIMIAEVPGTQEEYTEINVEGGLHYYYVTAVFAGLESEPSNKQYAFIMDEDDVEIAYDDGEADSGYSVGASRQMAVRFDEYVGNEFFIKHAAVYIHTLNPANMLIRVYTVGENGMPAGQIAQIQYPAASLFPGWNYIPFPEPVLAPNGKFFLSVFETPGASLIGVDNSSTGNSFVNLGTWQEFINGNFMIRAIGEVGDPVSNEDDLAPVITFGIKNYPNPFNPSTTISYSLPEAGLATVRVFNLKGQLIKTLVNQEMEAGHHSVIWNGDDHSGNAVSSGIYFLRIDNAGKSINRKMLLSK